MTTAPDMPVTLGLPAKPAGFMSGGFVAKLQALGRGGEDLMYSGYLAAGGYRAQGGNGIAVNRNGEAYVTGAVDGTDYPTANAVQPEHGGGPSAAVNGSTDPNADGFVAKISATGTGLLYSTYLGGGAADFGNAIAVGGDDAIVVGETESANFPVAPAPDAAHPTAAPYPSSMDGGAFVARIHEPSSLLPAPAQLSASPASSQAIDISWDAVLHASGYAVERSPDGTQGWSRIGTPAAASYHDAGLQPSTTYYYRVRTESASGESDPSGVVSATTTPAHGGGDGGDGRGGAGGGGTSGGGGGTSSSESEAGNQGAPSTPADPQAGSGATHQTNDQAPARGGPGRSAGGLPAALARVGGLVRTTAALAAGALRVPALATTRPGIVLPAAPAPAAGAAMIHGVPPSGRDSGGARTADVGSGISSYLRLVGLGLGLLAAIALGVTGWRRGWWALLRRGTGTKQPPVISWKRT